MASADGLRRNAKLLSEARNRPVFVEERSCVGNSGGKYAEQGSGGRGTMPGFVRNIAADCGQENALEKERRGFAVSQGEKCAKLCLVGGFGGGVGGSGSGGDGLLKSEGSIGDSDIKAATRTAKRDFCPKSSRDCPGITGKTVPNYA